MASSVKIDGNLESDDLAGADFERFAGHLIRRSHAQEVILRRWIKYAKLK